MLRLYRTKTKKMKNISSSKIWRKVSNGWAITAAGILVLIIVPLVHADTLQQQIDNLNTQNNQTQQQVDTLQLQATSFQDAINQLQAQINGIQQAIQASQTKQAELTQAIQADEVKLVHERQVLGEDIKSQYVEGQLSTIEMLATSKSISSFVDSQVYQQSLADQIQQTLTDISNIENQQKDEQKQVAQLLVTQKSQEDQLNNDQGKQVQLLGYNQDQQNQYNQQILDNKSKITALQAEQAAINERNASSIAAPAGGGNGGKCATPYPWYTGSQASAPNGGYPLNWCNSDQDSLTTYGNFPSRECTSFAYWYFTTQESGHNGFSVTGNADQWWATANRPVDQIPADGAIAVDPSGPFGHVMIVVASPGETYAGSVVPSGYIDTISMNDDYYGHFFSLQRSLAGFYFIH
jgi:peptidoglycan hydrolase CwlO-like protein